MSSAYSFLKQERRFLLGRIKDQTGIMARLFTTIPSTDDEIDTVLEKEQKQIQADTPKENTLGLYRNASLTLASLYVHRACSKQAYEEILDVIFLDVQGASNSLPGYKSYDRKLSYVTPFAIEILKEIAADLSLTPDLIKRDFEQRWRKFVFFGSPPLELDKAWKKIKIK